MVKRILTKLLTIYRRFVSYQDVNDFKRDVRLLLVPVRLGGQALSWAVSKIDSNRNCLPTRQTFKAECCKQPLSTNLSPPIPKEFKIHRLRMRL